MSHRYIPKNIFSVKQPSPKLNVSWIELRFFTSKMSFTHFLNPTLYKIKSDKMSLVEDEQGHFFLFLEKTSTFLQIIVENIKL